MGHFGFKRIVPPPLDALPGLHPFGLVVFEDFESERGLCNQMILSLALSLCHVGL